jgi:hypothetical protein
MRDDVPPKVGGGWIAMEENDRLSFAHIDVAHLRIENGDALSGMRVRWYHLGLLKVY